MGSNRVEQPSDWRTPTAMVRVSRDELAHAASQMRERGLIEASQFVSALATSLPRGKPRTRLVEVEEDDASFELARIYFEQRQYRQCASSLKDASDSKSCFLRWHALALDAVGKPEELQALRSSLALASDTDAFHAYLHATLLIECEAFEEAKIELGKSIRKFPLNWSAWMALAKVVTGPGELASLDLPKEHFMADFFSAFLAVEFQDCAKALELYQNLAADFPNSDYVVAQAALVHYNLRNFDRAQALYEQLLSKNPDRIQGMDVYSNILYVKEAFAELSFLAHRAMETAKYTPEACCIAGNYFSLRQQHEKAVLYFRRALKLNPDYLSAWTLMGHEYLELKNPPAAIDAYRRAVGVSPRDYRAWYGLGQTYEFLQMPYYALYYYRRAAQLRPTDARMWCAMGQCYESEKLDMASAAIRCYRRAYINDDREGVALHKLANLHKQLGQDEYAAHYFRKNLIRINEEKATGSDAVEALLFLAAHCRNIGSLSEAEEYCTQLLDFGGPAKEKAKSLLMEIRNMQDLQDTPSPGGMDISYSP